MNEKLPPENEASSLTNQTFRRIYSMIIHGDLKPGEKLKIENLRQMLGTGSSPVREALSLLTSEQLVERIDNRGFRVTCIDAVAFGEPLKTRCWLEERALRESMRSKDMDWEEHLLLAHHRLKRTPRSLDDGTLNPEWEVRHKAFHMALLSACGSSILIKICDQLYDQNIRYRNIAGAFSYPERDAADEHNAIIDHVLEGNEDKAVEQLVSHYSKTGKYLLQSL